MLIEFSVENFKSFKNMTRFSMLKNNAESGFEGNYIQTDISQIGGKKKNLEILKTSAIYGANASGKSNLLKAMKILKLMVMNSMNHKQGQPLPVAPFKLDDNCLTKPTFFQIIFIKNDIRYVYTTSMTQQKILEESLYYYPNGRRNQVFLRKNNDIKINFGSDKPSEEDKMRQKIYAKDIADNILFLSLANRINIMAIKSAYDWIAHKLFVVLANEMLEPITTPMFIERPELQEQILNYLKNADKCIQSMRMDKTQLPANDPMFVDIKQKRMLMAMRNDEMSNELLNRLNNEPVFAFSPQFQRYGKDINGQKKTVDFRESEESMGTLKYYGLIGPFINALEKGQVLICDEIDNSLHFLLVKSILELFTSKINKNNAQFIISTHNVYLLEMKTLFRKDQIWLTEKDIDGKSDLYSISDFKGIKRQKVTTKNYLKGKFGAIPQIDLENLENE